MLQLGKDGELARVYDKDYGPFGKIRAPWTMDYLPFDQLPTWKFKDLWQMVHGDLINFEMIFDSPDDTTDFLSLLFSLALS